MMFMRPLELAVAGLMLTSIACQTTATPAPRTAIGPHDIDAHLQPGDVLLKLAKGDIVSMLESSPYSVIISGGQSALWAVRTVMNAALKEQDTARASELVNDSVTKGDASVIHGAIYLGGGQVAEASGKADAVLIRSVFQELPHAWEVFRPTDDAWRERAAAIARTWAEPARMKYDVPVFTIVRLASFGPAAREEAQIFARAANTPGGPPEFDKMYCSQFALAVYQAASSTPGSPPASVAVHATHASPMTMHGKLVEGVAIGEWRFLGVAAIAAR